MKTYKNLLDTLTKLSLDQLNLDIVILNDGIIIDGIADFIVNKNPLFQFIDTDHKEYYDFEDPIERLEFNGKLILNENYPIIVVV